MKKLAVILLFAILMGGVVSAQLSQEESKLTKNVPDILGLKVPFFVEAQNLIKRWNQPISVISGEKLSVHLDPTFKGINPFPPKLLIKFVDPKTFVTITVTFSGLGTSFTSVSSNFVLRFG
ncbi:MAG: hypothetical protein KKE23_03570 [Nanoarchaeota archaeon]|nr:hypothetical protein [Nanoarchaeota archaeon]